MSHDVDNHPYLGALEFAYRTPIFTENEACNALNLKHIQFDLLRDAGPSRDAIWKNRHEKKDGVESFEITFDAAMSYQERMELLEARAQSRQANKNAMWAIGISAALALGSIGNSFYLASKPTATILDKDQLAVLAPRETIRIDATQIDAIRQPHEIRISEDQLEALRHPVIDFPKGASKSEP